MTVRTFSVSPETLMSLVSHISLDLSEIRTDSCCHCIVDCNLLDALVEDYHTTVTQIIIWISQFSITQIYNNSDWHSCCGCKVSINIINSLFVISDEETTACWVTCKVGIATSSRRRWSIVCVRPLKAIRCHFE